MTPAFPGKGGANQPLKVVVEHREYHTRTGCNCDRLEARIAALESGSEGGGCLVFLLAALFFCSIILFNTHPGFHANVIREVHRVLEIQDSAEK